MFVYIKKIKKFNRAEYGNVILVICNKTQYADFTNRYHIMVDNFRLFLYPDKPEIEKRLRDEEYRQSMGHYRYFPDVPIESFTEKQFENDFPEVSIKALTERNVKEYQYQYLVHNSLLNKTDDNKQIPSLEQIRNLVESLANMQSEAKREFEQKGEEDRAFGTYHSLETYKMPLYYAWEGYKYGHHKDLSEIKGDPLMSFSIFESDMIGITKQLINLLKTKQSPIYKMAYPASLPDDLISVYSTFINDIIEGNINF